MPSNMEYERWLDDSHEDAEWFTYQCRVDRVVDGDTLDLVVDMGFQTRRTIRVRLGGLDTGEIYGVSQDSVEYAVGREHADFVESWVRARRLDESDASWSFVVTTARQTGKYGRYVALLWAKNSGRVLNADIVAEYPDVEDSD